ncbi:hypothetical protein SESBI_07679 [Sesbania bispinosa]|nr:hypothetical protein SESBI_07679 [Sesbania bispinosa]
MASAGMAWMTALMRISFPAGFSSNSFHPCILASTRSFIQCKVALLDLPHWDGRPKYFPGWSHILMEKISSIDFLVNWSIFLPHMIPDLDKLTL